MIFPVVLLKTHGLVHAEEHEAKVVDLEVAELGFDVGRKTQHLWRWKFKRDPVEASPKCLTQICVEWLLSYPW